MTGPRARVAIVGGGLAGLVTAYRLTQPNPDRRAAGALEPDVTVFEASSRAGGTIRTGTVLDCPIEEGPDSFVVRKPWAVDLCRDLGLADHLIHPGASGAFVWARDRLARYPEGSAFGVPSDVGSLLGFEGLSMKGRLRALGDLWRPVRRAASDADGDNDESIEALVSRRMGRECARVLVGPLLAGINSGDPARLSVRATFPELAAWERSFGSLIRGSKAARSAARERSVVPAPMFATLPGGLGRLVEALVQAIGPHRVAFGARIGGIKPGASRVGFELLDGNDEEGSLGEPDVVGPRDVFDAVVVATPALAAAAILRCLDPTAAADLEAIPYGSSTVVALVYPPGTAGRLPAAGGLIVPPTAGPRGSMPITACTWISRKWPNPAFGDRALVRVFVGGAERPPPAVDDEVEFVGAVCRELERMAPVGDVPDGWAITPWPESMPQYEVGHLERIDRIEAAIGRVPGLFVTGSAYRGVGIADVVRQANETAERVRGHLRITGDRSAATTTARDR